ncbi:MAG: VWA domain-containing protein [Ruminiclostridium sp.]|nr:VWA domain-containing protein [Ruminococcus sp.]MBR1832638.1 VWA domain-containing protein [Ruminiclostridium sp.]
MNGYTFPFTAVAGQDRVKLALILNAIDPAIGGVLISGEKGTAKSTLVRGLASASGKRVTELPLNVTEDRLVGTLDLSCAVKDGERHFESGLLYEADGNFLYVDEVNLLSAHISNILTEAVSTGENIVQRDGISYRHPCRFALVGTMNPEEGSLRPQLLDRFGLFVNARSETDIEVRTEIIRRRLEYENDPTMFLRKCRDKEEALAERISAASERLDDISVPDGIVQLIALTASRSCCEGNRCELILAETARALCAWRGGTEVNADDVSEAAKFVLPHRMRNDTSVEVSESSGSSQDTSDEENYDNERSENDISENEQTGSSTDKPENRQDNTESAGRELPLSADGIKTDKKKNGGSGKRSRCVTNELTGRYVRSRIPTGKCCDIALIPTLCGAALHQQQRTPLEGMSIAVRSSDLRCKIREKHTGATILFVVDASGSMGAKRRMRAVKGAVRGLLSEAYRKRDRVGVVAFRGEDAQVLLSITSSPELARRCMDELPTGGKTPLAAGIAAAGELLRAERIRMPDALQYLILISDGKANVPLDGTDPFGDALSAAERIGAAPIGTMVLDTENSYIRFGFAKKIAERMGAEYIRLDEVTGSAVEENVLGFVGKNIV